LESSAERVSQYETRDQSREDKGEDGERKNINTDKHMIKLGLLNIRSPSLKALFANDMITDHKLDVLSLT